MTMDDDESEFEDISTTRVIVLLTKILASAYVVATVGKGLINATLIIGGFN
jgi:hypothetical protein